MPSFGRGAIERAIERGRRWACAHGEKQRMVTRVTVLTLTVCFLQMLIVSIGSCSMHLTPSIEFVVRRGAFEAAVGSHPVQSRQRDSWTIRMPSGYPGMGAALPPRTFWYPTVRQERLTFPAASPVGPVIFVIFLLQVPLAAPTAALAAWSLWLWWPWLRRKAPGRCASCAYDLTGNTSGTCPECGSVVDWSAAQK